MVESSSVVCTGGLLARESPVALMSAEGLSGYNEKEYEECVGMSEGTGARHRPGYGFGRVK
jgi:hypothetical protein